MKRFVFTFTCFLALAALAGSAWSQTKPVVRGVRPVGYNIFVSNERAQEDDADEGDAPVPPNVSQLLEQGHGNGHAAQEQPGEVLHEQPAEAGQDYYCPEPPKAGSYLSDMLEQTGPAPSGCCQVAPRCRLPGPSCACEQRAPSCQAPCRAPSCQAPCHAPSCHVPSCHVPSCQAPCHAPSCQAPCHAPSCQAPACGEALCDQGCDAGCAPACEVRCRERHLKKFANHMACKLDRAVCHLETKVRCKAHHLKHMLFGRKCHSCDACDSGCDACDGGCDACSAPSCQAPSCMAPSCHAPACNAPACHAPACNAPACQAPAEAPAACPNCQEQNGVDPSAAYEQGARRLQPRPAAFNKQGAAPSMKPDFEPVTIWTADDARWHN